MSRRHPRAGLRDRWVAAVVASDVGPSCKLLCLVLAELMGDHGIVNIPVKNPRQQLADLFGVHPQRIADRLAEARKAGLLNQIDGSGVRGRPARYIAVIPTGNAERYTIWQRLTGNRYALIGTHTDESLTVSGTHYARASTHVPQRRTQVLHINDLSPWQRLAYAPISRVDQSIRSVLPTQPRCDDAMTA